MVQVDGGHDVLYEGGTILTMDESVPVAEAMLVRGERIAAVGERAEVAGQAHSGAQRIDLAGQTVVPGFNDCHCHILSFGLNLQRLDVSVDAVRTVEDIKRVVAQRAERAAEGEWVLGRGYDQNALAERRHPTRQDLDEVSHGHPVVLWHTSSHGLTCNSRALELAGITANTAQPPGGEILRDVHGEPTGVLLEAPAMDLIGSAVPPPTRQQETEAILAAMQAMTSQGITSASDAATGEGEDIDAALAAYRGALASDRLAGRVTLMPRIQYVAPPHSDEARKPGDFDAGDRPDWLHIGATKIFSDGALTTRTAAVFRPFADSGDNRGILIWEPAVLAGMIARAHRAGWQIGTHAIGDRAIATVLDGYAQALTAAPRPDPRHRIEHCMLLDETLAARIRQLQIIPTIQPGFISRLGDAYIAALGIERASQLNPMQLFASFGIPVGFSSDRPVIPGAPLEGIRAAVLRTTPGDVLLGPEHAISARQAIYNYTAGSAYATHSEDRKGRLRAGMLADFTVLSQNPLDTPPEDLARVRVTATVVGGRESYRE